MNTVLPDAVFICMKAFLCLVALSLSPWIGMSAEERRTVVVPLPDEEILKPCEYRLSIPDEQRAVTAVWVIFDRGQDYLKWYLDSEIRTFAREHTLGLMLAMHCRSKEREDMIVEPAKGVGRALFTALDQFAESERLAELRAVPIIAMGWSGAGSLVGRMAGYRPKRYLAGIAYAPGQYDPLGMDTIELSAEAIRAPQLIIANGADNINGTERPYNYFKKYFDRGAPWTFVVQNRTPHCCLQNAQALILAWVHAILTTRADTRTTRSFGFIKAEPSVARDEWKNPVFNATSARVGPERRAMGGELPAGCMPSHTFASEWLKFVRRAAPVAVWKP